LQFIKVEGCQTTEGMEKQNIYKWSTFNPVWIQIWQ